MKLTRDNILARISVLVTFSKNSLHIFLNQASFSQDIYNYYLKADEHKL